MRPIKLTQQMKDNIIQNLDNIRIQSSKLNLCYDLSRTMDYSKVKKPIIWMSATTYTKMMEFVHKCDKEIAWHGTVERGKGNSKNIFHIKDVYLYPQVITGVTVKTDDTAYQKWSDEQSDEDFNNRRFQGHSHVNMATLPSGTDEANKNDFIQDLLDNDYYIFLITNKRHEHNFELYDLSQNITFSNADIDFRVYIDKDHTLNSIDADIKKYCVENIPKPTSSYKFTDFSKTDKYDAYWGKYNNTPTPSTKKNLSCKTLGIKAEDGRDFAKIYSEYDGDYYNYLGIDYFVPDTPFTKEEVDYFTKEGWRVFELDRFDELF